MTGMMLGFQGSRVSTQGFYSSTGCTSTRVTQEYVVTLLFSIWEPDMTLQ